MWVFLSVTHGESAGSFTKFLVVRTTKNSNTFTIISQKVAIAYLQNLYHARKVEIQDFSFSLALLAENFLPNLGKQQENCILKQHLY